ncbi:hypothetical protein TI39_contig4142g00010 [Zymoseptoria brevis]|uniref:Uncharacterized protein n=1 Tax=Zymoseptoria brevis TaxID=1047168 RepID=A0A0F4GDF6_9PEZI|nr:hypothetical protein TI39_contig4142g00010 [Zymoseptoria brevis]
MVKGRDISVFAGVEIKLEQNISPCRGDKSSHTCPEQPPVSRAQRTMRQKWAVDSTTVKLPSFCGKGPSMKGVSARGEFMRIAVRSSNDKKGMGSFLKKQPLI